MIFISHNAKLSWDGKIKGKYAIPDTYAWIITYRLPLGRFQEEKGVVSVLY